MRVFICSLMRSHILVRLQPVRRGGQLELLRHPKTTFCDVPFPVELHLPGVRVVSLAMTSPSVRIPFPILADTLVSHCSCVPTGLSTCLVLMVVCMSAVRIHLILPVPHQNLWILTMHCDRPFPTPRFTKLRPPGSPPIYSDTSEAPAAGSNTWYQVNSFINA